MSLRRQGLAHIINVQHNTDDQYTVEGGIHCNYDIVVNDPINHQTGVAEECEKKRFRDACEERFCLQIVQKQTKCFPCLQYIPTHCKNHAQNAKNVGKWVQNVGVDVFSGNCYNDTRVQVVVQAHCDTVRYASSSARCPC